MELNDALLINMANKILPEIVKKWSEFVRGVMGQIISEKSNNYAKSVRLGSSAIDPNPLWLISL